MEELEKNWGKTHRALAIEKVRQERDEDTTGGYLKVWPIDVSTSNQFMYAYFKGTCFVICTFIEIT